MCTPIGCLANGLAMHAYGYHMVTKRARSQASQFWLTSERGPRESGQFSEQTLCLELRCHVVALKLGSYPSVTTWAPLGAMA